MTGTTRQGLTEAQREVLRAIADRRWPFAFEELAELERRGLVGRTPRLEAILTDAGREALEQESER